MGKEIVWRPDERTGKGFQKGEQVYVLGNIHLLKENTIFGLGEITGKAHLWMQTLPVDQSAIS